jgi:hypothetical protein
LRGRLSARNAKADENRFFEMKGFHGAKTLDSWREPMACLYWPFGKLVETARFSGI